MPDSHQPHPMPSPARTLETITLLHLGGLLLFAAWAFGGNIDWARTTLAAWGSLAPLILVAALRTPGATGTETRRRLWWLLPWGLLSTLVLLSCLNPSFIQVRLEGELLNIQKGPPIAWLPSTINPTFTFNEWWFASAVYLSAFNLVITVRRREALRTLLTVVCVSAFLLAVMGTLQKLSAHDLYFGAVKSPNPRFFATFIYYNHWGAYLVLTAAACFGLLFHHAARSHARNVWHSPVTGAVLATLVLIATAPISASRAATAMSLVLLGAASLHALSRIVSRHRTTSAPDGASRASVAVPVIALGAFVAVALAVIAWLALPSIQERTRDTQNQLSRGRLLGDRLQLYQDTWELTRQKPVFGWGLESFGSAFTLIRPRPLQASRQYEKSYVEAHSDWLQSLAETGFAGTACALAMGVLPLGAVLRRRHFRNPVISYLLAGTGLVALYAWVEFPFANGAVLATFWALLFCALRYAQLTDATVAASSPSA